MKTNLSKQWLLAALLLIAACGGSNRGDSDDLDEEEEEVEDGYQSPAEVDDDDWQTVSADGTTIEEDDITIVFSPGTFQSDTEVAVTKMEEGEILDEDEVSPFYQITMPGKTAKEFTVKIASEEYGDDIHVMVHAPGRAISVNQATYYDIPLESTYQKGEHTVTIPKFDSQSNSDNVSFCIGLAQVSVDNNRNESLNNSRVGGKVDNISWTLSVPFRSLATMGYWPGKDIITLTNEALQKIKDVGFWISENRNIPIVFRKFRTGYFFPEADADGNFIQSKVTDSWNSIEINMNRVFSGKWDNSSKTKLGKVLIHELTHYFQSDYDPKWWPMWKASSQDDYNMLYESGAVWNEKNMDKGSFSYTFVIQYLPYFIRCGFDHQQEIVDETYNAVKSLDPKPNDPFANHGYGMAALLQYFSNLYGDHSIIDIYKIWKATPYENVSKTSSIDIFKEYAKEKGSNLFEGNHYDDFILALAQGKVDNNIRATDLMPSELSGRLKKILKTDGKIEFQDKCYPYGCTPMICNFQYLEKKYKNEKGSLKDKQITITQHCEGVHTYVTVRRGNVLCNQKVTKGSPLVISGDELEEMRNNNGVFPNDLTCLTMTDDNSKVMNAQVSIELGDQEEKAKNVKTFRTNMYVDLKVIKSENIDGQTTESAAESKDYTIGFANMEDRDPYITTTVSGKTLKVMCVDEEGGKKETLSYDILNFTDVMKDTLMKQMRVANVAYDLHTVYQDYSGKRETHRSFKVAGPLKFAGNEPFGNSFGKYTFSKMEMDGLKLDYLHKTTETGSDGKVTVTEYKFVPDKFNSVMISLEFYPNKKPDGKQ